MSQIVNSENLLDYYYRYPRLIQVLYNIYHHMKEEKFDYPIAIVGNTGLGKSMFNLIIIELWYRVILERPVQYNNITKYVNVKKEDWLKNFKLIEPFELNSNDEAADGLTSKQSMKSFSRDLEKLYMVFRKLKFFTPILIPDFFDLPKYFRKRIRGCLYVNERGKFKFYTQEDLKYVNTYNENRSIKRMEVAYCSFEGSFPNYKGELQEVYDEMALDSAHQILDEVIMDNSDRNTTMSPNDVLIGKMLEVYKEGHKIGKVREIMQGKGISARRFVKLRDIAISQGMLPSTNRNPFSEYDVPGFTKTKEGMFYNKHSKEWEPKKEKD